MGIPEKIFETGLWLTLAAGYVQLASYSINVQNYISLKKIESSFMAVTEAADNRREFCCQYQPEKAISLEKLIDCNLIRKK